MNDICIHKWWFSEPQSPKQSKILHILWNGYECPNPIKMRHLDRQDKADNSYVEKDVINDAQIAGQIRLKNVLQTSLQLVLSTGSVPGVLTMRFD